MLLQHDEGVCDATIRLYSSTNTDATSAPLSQSAQQEVIGAVPYIRNKAAPRIPPTDTLNVHVSTAQ